MEKTLQTSVTAMAGLVPGSAAAAEVAARETIFLRTQEAEDAVLRPADPGGLSHDLRHALAARIAAVNAAPALAARYGQAIVDPELRPFADPVTGTEDRALAAMLAFTDAVARNPRDFGAGDLSALQTAGVADADIVRLAELNAFLAYQLRLIAGLKLMVENPA
ncbi:hypothetical protein [Pseudogemmobacter sonorensis]|uniref:hypothetical protein n=1 Tax=Pseudogemmobacter sonorensis TaxID=2989681 RepID=UPI0036B30C3C